MTRSGPFVTQDDINNHSVSLQVTEDDLGFDGKSLVHPFQLPYCNDAFTPSLNCWSQWSAAFPTSTRSSAPSRWP